LPVPSTEASIGTVPPVSLRASTELKASVSAQRATADVVYDVTNVWMRPLHGIEEIRSATLELGADKPVAHHVTNIVITCDGEDCVRVRSKALAVMANGHCGSATYFDTLRRQNGRWRISHRVILARRTPLNRADTAGRDGG
jgi:4-diphosphocytidyl-2C-methyl-D-erythritol kinase